MQVCLCRGGYFLYKQSSPWILNLATQDTKFGVKMEYVERCLVGLSEYFGSEGITSLAIPRIGAGLGGLDWHEVKKLIVDILDPIPLEVFVYEEYVAS
jgi:O-acetyl-ADP-ribose deacetylase (regulator of RNase III)